MGSQAEVFEFSGMVGDEAEGGHRDTTINTVVRVAFTGEDTCILVRQTYYRYTTGSYTWDICSGTYTTKESNVVACTWHCCYRRRRAVVERNGLCSLDDSGWIKRQRIPELYNEVNHCSEAWKKTTAMFQERDRILDIKLAGRGSC